MSTVIDTVTEFINLNFSADGEWPDAEKPLYENEELDSAGMLELVLFLEQQYDIEISDADVTAGNFATVAALVRYIESKLSQGRLSVIGGGD